MLAVRKRLTPTGMMDNQPRMSQCDAQVVDALLESYQTAAPSMQHVDTYSLPSSEEVAEILDRCLALLFPGFVGASLARATPTELRAYVQQRVSQVHHGLSQQLYRGLHHKKQSDRGTRDLDCPHCQAEAHAIAERFLQRLVELRNLLALDVQAHFDGDPAATGLEEIIFCYPGLHAIAVYRIAHTLLEEGAKILPRIMTEIAHRRTGIDIHPGATIGESFFIDHGTGVVIGETTHIGDRVRVYQGVTLGALSIPRGQQRPTEKRHPTIENDVVLYAGATILGGDTVVGEGSIIGGNCWVTRSVPPKARVTLEGGLQVPKTSNP